MSNKIKNNWGINVVGTNGYTGQNDVEFGSIDDIPVFKLGETIVNPGTISNNSPFKTISKISDYLYEITYEDINYDYGYSHVDVEPNMSIGACSSVRNGNWCGRNFDWYYNNQVNFVIHTKHTDKHYASVGVTGVSDTLTKDFVESGKYSNIYEVLPFYTQDGINEFGVVCNLNVVPLQKGKTYGTKPTENKKQDLSMTALVRYVLDNYDSATNAVEDIVKHVSIHCSDHFWKNHYEAHAMIADSEKTYLMEFIDNQIVVTDMTEGSNSVLAGKPYMTNFHLSNIVLNNDGTVYTPETQDSTHNAIITNKITTEGSGLERYNCIVDNYSSTQNRIGMTNLMFNLLKYTNAYDKDEDPYWYTEFVGIYGLNVASLTTDFSPIVEYAQELYENRDRNRGTETWCTNHTSIYDIENKKLYIYSQEQENEFTFSISSTMKYLPRVSSSDNGATLQVVDGEWTVVQEK